MNRIRQDKIRSYVENKNIATIKELQNLLPNVSLMTIHRDLDALEKQGVLAKYRGGVKSIKHFGDVEFNVRLKENNPGKLLMAKKAISLLQPHSSVFLDAGTSNLFVAQNMPDININVITTSPNIALELSRLRKPVITLCGGSLNRNNLAVSGHKTIEMLEGINIDTAFIGVSGCSAESGFTCGTEGDSYIKKMVITKARTSILMCGTEKLKCLMPYTFAHFADVDYIVSDMPLPESYVKLAKENSVTLL